MAAEQLLTAVAGSPPGACLVLPAINRAWSMPELAGRATGLGLWLRPTLGDRPRRLWLAIAGADQLLASVMALSGTHSCVLVDPGLTGYEYEALAAGAPPAAVIVAALTGAAPPHVRAWAGRCGVPVLDIHEKADRRIPHGGNGNEATPGIGLFTSGTTGLPALVELTIEQVVAAARGVAARLRLGPADTALAINELNHTLGFVTTLLAPLLAGGRTVVCGFHAPGLLDAASTHRPTWCASSPALLRQLLRMSETGMLALPHLRLLRASSAPLTPALQRRLGERFQIPVLNAYAMTEAPGEIASQPLPPERSRIGSVGRPTLCEVSVRAGEIWVRGPNVAQAKQDSEGWLRTGDLGVLEPDGELTLLGRVDDVINYGGEKFAPQEVEAVAEMHPGVVQAVAFPVHDDVLGQKVGLAVVLRGEVSRRELRAHLLDHLSPGKIPQTIRRVPAIPTTRRGKVVRSRMPQLLATLPGVSELA